MLAAQIPFAATSSPVKSWIVETQKAAIAIGGASTAANLRQAVPTPDEPALTV